MIKNKTSNLEFSHFSLNKIDQERNKSLYDLYEIYYMFLGHKIDKKTYHKLCSHKLLSMFFHYRCNNCVSNYTSAMNVILGLLFFMHKKIPIPWIISSFDEQICKDIDNRPTRDQTPSEIANNCRELFKEYIKNTDNIFYGS